jgi:predicted 3-demethylubiquinone-9 3-methyltransferase (glyoxalase superfamily)
MQKIVPCLWFDDQAEEAVQFYTAIFRDGRVDARSRYPSATPDAPGKVLTINFQLAGRDFMALNGGPDFAFTPAISFFVACPTEAELTALWEQLMPGGFALMPLDAYDFSPRFGWVQDRFGLSWQLILSPQVAQQKITPCLLFVGAQFGQAEAAMTRYTAIFPNSRLIEIQRREAGTVSYATFELAGETFAAMESDETHEFSFTPALSFLVNCESQAEVDSFWAQLTQGGAAEQCGWLRDPYEVSWQIVPTRLGELMNTPDPAQAQRVHATLMQMTKIELGPLEAAAGV